MMNVCSQHSCPSMWQHGMYVINLVYMFLVDYFMCNFSVFVLYICLFTCLSVFLCFCLMANKLVH